MTGLTNTANTKLSASFAVLCFLVVVSVYAVVCYIGYVTLAQAYENLHGLSILFATIYLLVLSPGLSTLITAYFFFLRRQSWSNSLLGILACIISGVIHFFISVPATHLNEFWAFSVGLSEVLITTLVLFKLEHYLNND